MKIVITGGAGFLGQRLATTLLRRGRLVGASGRSEKIDRIVLLDLAFANGETDPRLRAIGGDVADPALLRKVIDAETDAVFHLAAVVSGQAEADFDLGMRVNVEGARHLLEACRATGRRPRVVFTSSVAVYGGALPDLVRDDTALKPQSSYGVQKAIAELLLADYHRKGFVDGRALRLPTVSVRPGGANKAASSFASGIIREPLNGEEAICPVPLDTRIWLLSPRRAVAALIAGHDIASEALGDNRSVNLPGLSMPVAAMIESLSRVAGPEVVARIRHRPDETITRIVRGWTAAWDITRARALGFEADESFDAVIRAHIEDEIDRR
jgi:nucleoside-diphosphate-sugar epimerase